MLDRTIMDVGRNGDRRRTKQRRTLNGMERNLNGMELERNGIKIKTKQMDDNYANDSIIEWSTSASFVAMACRREFFFFYFLFFLFSFFLFLLLELLQGLLTTWLQAQKHIGMHNPYANVKTHVQGKQVYVGLHHLVHILYCNQTLCVCVCSQDLKLVVKQTLELLAPSSFRNSET